MGFHLHWLNWKPFPVHGENFRLLFHFLFPNTTRIKHVNVSTNLYAFRSIFTSLRWKIFRSTTCACYAYINFMRFYRARIINNSMYVNINYFYFLLPANFIVFIVRFGSTKHQQVSFSCSVYGFLWKYRKGHKKRTHSTKSDTSLLKL